MKVIFVNLPAKDLAAAARFHEAIGCEKNGQFSDDQASSMIWSETVTFQRLARDSREEVARADAGCRVGRQRH